MLPHHKNSVNIYNFKYIYNFKSITGKSSGPTCHCCVCTLDVWYHSLSVFYYRFIGHCAFNVFTEPIYNIKLLLIGIISGITRVQPCYHSHSCSSIDCLVFYCNIFIALKLYFSTDGISPSVLRIYYFSRSLFRSNTDCVVFLCGDKFTTFKLYFSYWYYFSFALVYSIECRYSALQYNVVLYTVLRRLRQNLIAGWIHNRHPHPITRPSIWAVYKST